MKMLRETLTRSPFARRLLSAAPARIAAWTRGSPSPAASSSAGARSSRPSSTARATIRSASRQVGAVEGVAGSDMAKLSTGGRVWAL
jgi:hypothetical protein